MQSLSVKYLSCGKAGHAVSPVLVLGTLWLGRRSFRALRAFGMVKINSESWADVSL